MNGTDAVAAYDVEAMSVTAILLLQYGPTRYSKLS